MQEVIDELLKAEAEAQQLIVRAQEEAQKMKSQVETDYSAKVSETREQARRTVLARAEQARKELGNANMQALKKAQAEIESRFREQQPAIEHITAAVIDLIVTPEYERDAE
jgi:vacuolar-type H+-ATPase subunit H